MEIDVTPEKLLSESESASNLSENENCKITVNNITTVSNESVNNDNSNVLNKKVLKHALRQQVKRRRKNTTLASGYTSNVPRIIVKPIPPPESLEEPKAQDTAVPTPHARTMREVLASIPGFTMKQRKRTNKKLSPAAQLEQTKEGHIDLETPDSILVNTNLRLLLNKATFASLPILYQNKLVQLLPSVDRQLVNPSDPNSVDISNSGLNNEFFARACVEWQDRLAEGEFTPENQQKLKLEAEKERSKLDPWKLKHFEPIWGDRSNDIGSASRPPIKTTIKLRPSTSLSTAKSKSIATPPPVKRLRTVGAMTRSCLKEMESMAPVLETTKSPIPDLLPIKSLKSAPKDETKFTESKESTLTVENCIINISDTIMKNNEETIIICRENEVKTEKRRRSISSERDISTKRKSPSPVNVELAEESQDVKEIIDELVEKLPESTDQVDMADSEKELTEYEDSNSSNTQDDLFRPVANQDSHIDPLICAETVDLSELNCDIKEDSCYTDDSTTTDKTEEDSPQDDNSDSESRLILDSESQTQCSNSDEQMDDEKQSEDSLDKPNDVNEASSEDIDDSFRILPNTLILQQESILLEKGSCSEICEDGSCMEESAEKLEASVEESDLVITQLTHSTFGNIEGEEANEDRFIDAENYVLESGQISIPDKVDKCEDTEVDIQATLFGESSECCWGLVDSSSEKLLEVPLHVLDSVASVVQPNILPSSNNEDPIQEHVEVIPMQEELEVKLEQGNFPVPPDWSYVKMESQHSQNSTMSDGALNSTEKIKEKPKRSNSFPEFSTGNQVKLELEVTLTPEIVTSDNLITSTVTNTNAKTTVTSSVSKTVTTVIPPTTIVCLPSVVSTAPIAPNASVNEVASLTAARPGLVQSSSALPFIALSTSQPIRAVPTHSKAKPKGGSSNRNRNNNKPPPGAVNLERSYQICQAVIQNSPNRDQLRCQLKPPPSLLAAATTNNAKKTAESKQTQYSSVSSSRTANKTFTPPLNTSGNYQLVQGGNGVTIGQKSRSVAFQQRQPSPPVVVRHVFTSGQRIPVTMAVLPQASTLNSEVVEGPINQIGNVGQYILVQRAGINEQQTVPRSSSAPPLQPQIANAINTGGNLPQLITVNNPRGRPASADTDHAKPSNDLVVQSPNPGTQAVTRRQQRVPQTGVIYGDVSLDNQMHNYTIIGDNILVDHPGAQMQPHQVVLQKTRPAGGVDSSCACSLKAMVVCKKCGAFCHDDCIGPNMLCRTCFIR